VIRIHLLVLTDESAGAVIYLNPQYIERVYASVTHPNNSLIVLTTGVPNIDAYESPDQLVYAIKASKGL
jgi:hypothetical protein